VGDFVFGDKVTVSGSNNTGVYHHHAAPPAPVPAAPEPAAERGTVLLLMSNPWDTGRLQLDEEYRAIDNALAAARFQDRIELRSAQAVRYSDLQTALLRHRPTVVHFSGHGSAAGGIHLADERGNALVVAPSALSELFGILAPSIRCVLLNACFTRDQATAIAAHVPCVVGMSREVPDSAATEFAGAFYYALADGQPVGTAFELGRNLLDLRGTHHAETPVLIAHPNVAERVYLTR